MQRIFDIENEKDMADLWDIIPDSVDSIERHFDTEFNRYCIGCRVICESDLIKIDWHDKNEITRPIQEATEQDIGKLCAFWDYKEEIRYGRLDRIINQGKMTFYSLEGIRDYYHARRLTKQEIEEFA